MPNRFGRVYTQLKRWANKGVICDSNELVGVFPSVFFRVPHAHFAKSCFVFLRPAFFHLGVSIVAHAHAHAQRQSFH